MVANFLLNIMLYSGVLHPFRTAGYLATRAMSLLLQIYFFSEVINIATSPKQHHASAIISLGIIIILTTGSSYLSRMMALGMQQRFIDFLINQKLKDSKSLKLNWIRPIVIELWNVMDSVVLLVMVSVAAIVISFEILPLVLLIVAAVGWVVVSKVYVNAWRARKGGQAGEHLFWRLAHQNVLDSVALASFLFAIAIFVIFYSFDDLETETVALFFVVLRVFSTLISKQISIIPRVARYFTYLPDWPVFWSHRIWIWNNE